METLTEQGTQETLNRSDTQMPTMSLGGGGAQMQSVTGSGVRKSSFSSVKDAGAIDTSVGDGGTMPNKPKEEPKETIKDKEQLTETPKETTPEKTQGDQAQKVDDINRAIEKWNELLDKGSSWNDFITSLNKYEYEQFEKYLKDNNIQLDPNGNKNKETLNAFISHLLGNYKNELHGIKTDQSYDNRTDEQIRNDKLLEEQRQRDDTAHQRMVDDMRAAGLNPAAFKGANYGGGGGGGSGSKDEDEEEKRKRRRREKFEQDRARRAEQLRQQELITGIVTNLMGTATKGVGAAAYMANSNKQQELNRRDQWQLRQEQRDHELNRLANIEEMKYDEELERWLRQKTGKSRR